MEKAFRRNAFGFATIATILLQENPKQKMMAPQELLYQPFEISLPLKQPER
jgi:hypothetical protein